MPNQNEGHDAKSQQFFTFVDNLSCKCTCIRVGTSTAIDQTQEPGSDTILIGQLVVKQPDSGKRDHMIQAIIAPANSLIPYGNSNIDCLKNVQGLAHFVTIGNSGFALHPIANRNNNEAMQRNMERIMEVLLPLGE